MPLGKRSPTDPVDAAPSAISTGSAAAAPAQTRGKAPHERTDAEKWTRADIAALVETLHSVSTVRAQELNQGKQTPGLSGDNFFAYVHDQLRKRDSAWKWSKLQIKRKYRSLGQKYKKLEHRKQQTGSGMDVVWTLRQNMPADSRVNLYPFSDDNLLTLWVEMTGLESLPSNNRFIADFDQGGVSARTESQGRDPCESSSDDCSGSARADDGSDPADSSGGDSVDSDTDSDSDTDTDDSEDSVNVRETRTAAHRSKPFQQPAKRRKASRQGRAKAAHPSAAAEKILQDIAAYQGRLVRSLERSRGGEQPTVLSRLAALESSQQSFQQRLEANQQSFQQSVLDLLGRLHREDPLPLPHVLPHVPPPLAGRPTGVQRLGTGAAPLGPPAGLASAKGARFPAMPPMPDAERL